MFDQATRRELAALVYERAEQDIEHEPQICFLGDEAGAQLGAPRRWYNGLLLCPSVLVY